MLRRPSAASPWHGARLLGIHALADALPDSLWDDVGRLSSFPAVSTEQTEQSCFQ